MLTTLKIGDVMHPFPHTVGKDQTLAVAKEKFEEYGIRHLPVCDGGQLCGIITARDVDFALRIEKVPADALYIRDCCTSDPYAVNANTPTRDVVQKMAEERIGCAIITKNDRVVGIFTSVDACRALANILSGIVIPRFSTAPEL